MGLNTEPTEVILPLHSERLEVSKHDVVTAKVTAQTETVSREETVSEMLNIQSIEVTREEVDALSYDMPQSYQDGDTLVIPVVEEVYVKQYHIKEVVKIKTVKSTKLHQEIVTLRSQDVIIQRADPSDKNDQSKEP
jgi:stress response protein YsnF